MNELYSATNPVFEIEYIMHQIGVNFQLDHNPVFEIEYIMHQIGVNFQLDHNPVFEIEYIMHQIGFNFQLGSQPSVEIEMHYKANLFQYDQQSKTNFISQAPTSTVSRWLKVAKVSIWKAGT
jgi:hypothetical protein